MPADMPAPTSPEHLVQVVTTLVAEKYPDLDRRTVTAEVEASYQRLARDCRITDQMAVLVQHDTIESLRQRQTA